MLKSCIDEHKTHAAEGHEKDWALFRIDSRTHLSAELSELFMSWRENQIVSSSFFPTFSLRCKFCLRCFKISSFTS